MHEPVARLEGVIREYAWGSHSTLAQLQRRAWPTAAPEAELWLGAHPLAPAVLCGADGARTPLDAAVRGAPDRMLGEPVVQRYGSTLPFLMKVLAVESPLSLQVHPDRRQARVGFEDEEARGIARDAPGRVFRDCWGKPELLCARSPMQVLCGFRPIADSVRLLRSLEISALDHVVGMLADDGEVVLGQVVHRLLTWPPPQRAGLVGEVAAALDGLARRGDRFAASARWMAALADRYRDDPGVVVALLLNLVDLAPGQAVQVSTGMPHAYLRGTGIEVMTTSDNVVRGGLTAKHVDVERLLAVLDPSAGPPPVVTAEHIGGERRYPSTSPAFRLSQRDVTERVTISGGGPQVLLTVDGVIEVDAPPSQYHPGRSLTLGPGQAAFVPASTQALELRGEGTVFRATTAVATGPEERPASAQR